MSSGKWANIGEDAGALHALIQRIPGHVPVEAIDYLWIFPPRQIAVGESTVVVVGAFDADPERRRVVTAHFTVSRNRKGAATVRDRFDEHGSAPEPAVPRIVQGVLRRLGEDADAEPRAEQVQGDPDRWNALITDLGGEISDEQPAVAPPAGPDDLPVQPDGAAASATDPADATVPPAPAGHAGTDQPDPPATEDPPVAAPPDDATIR